MSSFASSLSFTFRLPRPPFFRLVRASSVPFSSPRRARPRLGRQGCAHERHSQGPKGAAPTKADMGDKEQRSTRPDPQGGNAHRDQKPHMATFFVCWPDPSPAWETNGEHRTGPDPKGATSTEATQRPISRVEHSSAPHLRLRFAHPLPPLSSLPFSPSTPSGLFSKGKGGEWMGKTKEKTAHTQLRLGHLLTKATRYTHNHGWGPA